MAKNKDELAKTEIERQVSRLKENKIQQNKPPSPKKTYGYGDFYGNSKVFKKLD